MTFLEMQTDAIDLLHEIVNHPKYSLVKLKNYLNRGNLDFVRKTEAIEGTITITTVANQFEYDESDQSDLQYLKKPYQVRYVESATSERKLIPYRGGFTNLPKDKSYGIPDFYWLRNIGGKSRTDPSAFTGVRFGMWDIPSTASKSVNIDCFMWPRTLVEDTAVPEYKDAWHDAPVFYAAWRMFQMFSHLRPAWGKKALEMKAFYMEMVDTANEDLSVQDDFPFIPVDITERW